MKRDLIKQLIELTKQQSIALQAEDVDKFIELLNERQFVLDKINSLYEENPQLREQHEADLVEELMATDERNKIEFERQYDIVKEKLREIRMMKRNEGSYSDPYSISREEGVLFDKRNR